MILASITFGSLRGKNRQEAEDLVDLYLSSLFEGGQICGERFLTLIKGKLNAHVLLAAPRAMEARHHTALGKKTLARVVDLLGCEPVWKILDDDAGKTSSGWRGARSLHLATDFSDWYSPVQRGDGKRPVPWFMLPVSDEIKVDLYYWQKNFRAFDDVWIRSGALENQAYRELVDVRSDLSTCGRELCQEIEKGTGIPTYYYLMRFWGRSKGEGGRVCPACGGFWRTSEPENSSIPYRFHFRCEPCRLVSHTPSSRDGGRLARIGEYAPVKSSSRSKKS